MAPEDAALNNNFGYFLAKSGANLDEALAHARKAVASRPGVSQFDDTVGWIHLKRNELAEALERFRKIAREHPENAQYRYHLGLALVRSGDRAAGRSELLAALQAKPGPSDAAEIRKTLEGIAR